MNISKSQQLKGSPLRPFVFWLTGLPSAGKSTIAQGIRTRLSEWGYPVCVLDGDVMRQGLNTDLGFSVEDRKENIRRVGEVARLFVDAGVIPVVALISPYSEDRQKVRARFAPGHFVEIYVKADLAVCEKRDLKGYYQRARQGLMKEFTGISAPYEPPEHPEIIIDTETLTIPQSIDQVVEYLKQQTLLPDPVKRSSPDAK